MVRLYVAELERLIQAGDDRPFPFINAGAPSKESYLFPHCELDHASNKQFLEDFLAWAAPWIPVTD